MSTPSNGRDAAGWISDYQETNLGTIKLWESCLPAGTHARQIQTVTGNTKQKIQHLARRPILLAVSTAGLLLAVLCIIYASQYFPARAKLDAAIADARAKGEPIWFSDLDPGPERNPSEDAVRLLELCEQIVLWKEDEFGARIGSWRFFDPNDAALPYTPKEYERLQEVAETNADVLTAIQEIGRRSECWFTRDYAAVSPLYEPTPHIQALRRVECAASVDVAVALRSNNENRVRASVEGYLDLVNILRNEPDMVYEILPFTSLLSGMVFIERWSEMKPLGKKNSQQLELRLTQLERSLRLAPTVLNYRSGVLTFMANLDDRKNQESLLLLTTSLSFSKPSNSAWDWLEDILPGNPHQRQVNRWRSLLYRPKLLQEQVFVIEAMKRQAELIDQPGPVAALKMSELDNEIEGLANEMPLCDALIPHVRGNRAISMAVRQNLINALILLRLYYTYADGAKRTADLGPFIEAAIETAPAGYFSGKPLQFEVTPTSVSLFDKNSPLGPRRGEFTLRFFDTVDATDEESKED